MTVFSHGRAVELGRGGRYLSGEEPATGLSLFPDAILRVCPALPVRPRVFLPWPAADDASPEAADDASAEAAGDASAEAGARLRGEGYATIGALAPSDDPVAEAARLGCTHVLRDGAAVPLHPES